MTKFVYEKGDNHFYETKLMVESEVKPKRRVKMIKFYELNKENGSLLIDEVLNDWNIELGEIGDLHSFISGCPISDGITILGFEIDDLKVYNSLPQLKKEEFFMVNNDTASILYMPINYLNGYEKEKIVSIREDYEITYNVICRFFIRAIWKSNFRGEKTSMVCVFGNAGTVTEKTDLGIKVDEVRECISEKENHYINDDDLIAILKHYDLTLKK